MAVGFRLQGIDEQTKHEPVIESILRKHKKRCLFMMLDLKLRADAAA